MQTVTVSQITERLQRLSDDKLELVFDFVSYLLERQPDQESLKQAVASDSFQTMLASEAILRRDWERPEEDTAWAHL